MANPYRQGKSYLRQSLANLHRQNFYHNHPAGNGWEVAWTSEATGLTVYSQDGWFLTPNGKGTGWVVWQGEEGQPQEKLGYISTVTNLLFERQQA